MDKTEKLKVINRDAMKYTAIFLMFWGHLVSWTALLRDPGAFTYDILPLWQSILSHLSLFCPPVMFFFIADGYKYTRDRKKYALRLLIFALITQPPHWLVWVPIYGWLTTNVIFTLFLGLITIIVWECKLKLPLRLLLIAAILGFDVLISTDWSVFGELFILLLHIFRDNPKKRLAAFTAIDLLWKTTAVAYDLITGGELVKTLALNAADFIVVFLAGICMTFFYNGKKGKHPTFAKWFFYIFYPVHYLIIYAVYLLGG